MADWQEQELLILEELFQLRIKHTLKNTCKTFNPQSPCQNVFHSPRGKENSYHLISSWETFKKRQSANLRAFVVGLDRR